MTARFLIIAAGLALLLPGCGGGSSSTSSSGDGSEAAGKPFRIPVKANTPYVYEKEIRAKEKKSKNGLVGPEPKPVIPNSPPPRFVALADFTGGIGNMAFEGDKVTVQYLGVLYDTGKKFDSSWDRGKPLTFKLGSGTQVPGLEEGIQGMEVGDRREIVIPPDQAYGDKRVGSIPPDSTLVFVVDLLKVKTESE